MKFLDKYGLWIIVAILAYEIYRVKANAFQPTGTTSPVGSGTVDIPGFYDQVPGGAAAYNPDTVGM